MILEGLDVFQVNKAECQIKEMKGGGGGVCGGGGDDTPFGIPAGSGGRASLLPLLC